ncbi:MAG: C-terminal binding protein [Octadecabacter sp.]|nr:C-terminal binding protein [Octadecabacter sp.]
MTARVVVTDYTFPELAQERAAAQGAAASFVAYQVKSDGELAELVKDADVVAVQFATFGPLSCAAVKRGATIIRYGVGYDNIDLVAAKAAGLKVGYVPDYCVDEVAEHSCAAALTLLRKLATLDASVRKGEWTGVKHAKPMKPFTETTFGFFGMGQIGQAILGRLKGFGFSFIVADPGLSEAQAAEEGAKLVDTDTLLATADIISLNAPATTQTTNFFNMTRLSQMQPHTMIVNSARGQLIVEDDMAAALEQGVIGGAALDVFQAEPLPVSSRLRKAPNLLLTPHVAWYSEAAIERLQGLVAKDITRALNGDAPRKPVRM